MEKVTLLIGERKERETKRAVQGCNDYLRLGSGRSLQKLCDRYRTATEPLPPTRRIATLKTWSVDFGWQERAEAYDAEIQRKKTQYAESVMKSGLALAHERVSRLKDLAESLSGEIWDEDGALTFGKVWLEDAKQIGSGDFAERVDLIRFNHHLIEQLRGVLDDLAKEVGGRKQQLEHSGPGGKPIQTEDVTLDDARRARRVAGLLQRLKQRADTNDE